MKSDSKLLMVGNRSTHSQQNTNKLSINLLISLYHKSNCSLFVKSDHSLKT